MKHQNLTFSIPEDLKAILHTHVGKGGVSHFITSAIRKALAEEELQREQELDAAYEAANSDPDRLAVLHDWDGCDDVSDLVNDDDDWGWLQESDKTPKREKNDKSSQKRRSVLGKARPSRRNRDKEN